LTKKTSFIFPLAVGLLAASSPQQVYAQYDDSLSGAIASIACSKGGGENMTMVINLFINPMGYMGQGQSSNFYTTGLKLTNWLETKPTEKQKAQFVAAVFDKSTQKCPKNFGQNEYNNIRKQVSCYKKFGSFNC